MSVKLAAGERVIFEGHPSWRAILTFYLKGILIAAAAGVVTRVFTDSAGTVFLVILVIVAITVLVGFIKRVATVYTITDRRLNIKRGIISRDVQETRLERVQNVNYNQGLLERILQVGDVDFDTAGTGDYDFSFNGVANPEGVQQKVDEAMRVHDPGSHGLGEPRGAAPTETQPTQQQQPPQ